MTRNEVIGKLASIINAESDPETRKILAFALNDVHYLRLLLDEAFPYRGQLPMRLKVAFDIVHKESE